MRIGADLMHLAELDRLLTRTWFRAYAYAESELATASGFGPERRQEFLTGRFAGKEAVAKAIGTGFGRGVTPRQIAIERAGSGESRVVLTDAAAARAAALGVVAVQLSITHKADLVLAVALAIPSSA
ncbi:4'-phosphopantetheinyl transferase superfamily protein [Amycolatopsis sp. SID8362]|uniref:holo-ACP synthase n=1 Tax=Amycolatopsis sp. SID8362 TaxID=2690346 RepID=UPI00136DE320|nr:4'-phosphopantetheinyl transferase superfamily protein [Amycolatopsis sp. SID8362]NBH03212.1 4'-phosphopantetheinyl transferase superfamily protein [Amycolatopsis sp. SID8362]NED39913.1 4'-phosphopantetheinyl transferase superfamily protein [Amycolatopsis sp. SID8362]